MTDNLLISIVIVILACVFFHQFLNGSNKSLEEKERLIAQINEIIAQRAQVEAMAISSEAVRENGRLISEVEKESKALISEVERAQKALMSVIEEQRSVIEKQKLVIDSFTNRSTP